MAGGTFKAQNKIRPGAYINFKAVSKPMSKLGTRGVVTMPIAMSWGAPITELLSTDLLDGKSTAKIGYTAFDVESQLYREALKNCHKAIIYRLDTGGVKASGTVAPLSITAKYAGTVGNNISVSIVENGTAFDVITYYKGIEKNKQTATTVAGLIANDWVDFSGIGNLVASAGLTLSTGADGTVVPETYATYLGLIKSYNWNTMGIPYNVDINASIVTFIKNMRDTLGRKVQAVLYNEIAADYEGIISVNQGYATAVETISPTAFVAYVAGLTAGSSVDESNTYKVIDGAVSIVYPESVTPYGDEEIEEQLALGQMVLSTRQDGAVVIEQDINTLKTYTPDKSYAFSKNRVIRTLDEINNSVKLLFEKSYIGKVDNNEDGRSLFRGDIAQLLNTMQTVGALQDLNTAEDIVVSPGEAIDAVVADLAVKPVDSMEKLYMTVMVG